MVRLGDSNYEFAHQFEHFLDNVSMKVYIHEDRFNSYSPQASCITSMKLQYTNRCNMARRVTDCRSFCNFFNYYEIMYCTFIIENEMTEFCVMLLFAMIYCTFLCILYLTINV